MRVHYLKHVPFEGLGYIETWLKDHGHTLTGTHFFEQGYHLPTADKLDALIVMGGPMGVYDDQEYPWLKGEKVFIKTCIKEGKKVLGICLGAQLLACCLGAKVKAAPHKEIGWFPVQANGRQEKGTTASWLTDLFKNSPTVFHWHGDQFEIPEGAEDILHSPANTRQAFCLNREVLGLQFHLEVTEKNIEQMVKHGKAELVESKYVQTADTIQKGATRAPDSHQVMGKLLTHWLAK